MDKSLELFRPIFSKFQNLNLLNLINNLELGLVATGSWYYRIDGNLRLMCPLAHGFQANAYQYRPSRERLEILGPSSICTHELNLNHDERARFTSWWDNYCDRFQLIGLLKSILKERLEDADAVQNVIRKGESSHASN